MSSKLFDSAKDLYYRNEPFVLYRRPGENQLNLIAQEGTDLHYVGDFNERGFVMAPFHLHLPAVLIRPDILKADTYQSPDLSPANIDLDFPKNKNDEEVYTSLVSAAIDEIKCGILNKVVVSRKLVFAYKSLPIHAFDNLLRDHTGAFCYLWFHPEIGLWIGATPELLLTVEDKNLTTFSLAGTIPYVRDKEPTWSIKEVEEQEYVTHYITERLEGLCIGLSVSLPESVRAGNLWHLRSVIKAQIADNELKRVIASLHPTPAVCGQPKKAAFNYIVKHEPYDRKFYTGFLGELNLDSEGSCNLFVNLRCLEWKNYLATVYVGGGITDRSDPAQEWRETVHKSRTILDALFNYSK